MAKKMLVIAVLLILKLTSTSAHSVHIEEILPSGLLAHAEYQTGEADKPAILLIHGFLTVHTFNLIQNLSNELVDNGYTVLAPTLSLGISRRKSTLDCDALHLHSMENDLAEIDWWTNWLIKKGHRNIILVGHSSGALQVVHYANQYPHKELRQVIAISLISLERLNQKEFVDSINLANAMVARNDNSIQNFTIAYCTNNYASPARDYLSYASWSSKRVLDSLRKLKIKSRIIMGGNDIPVYPGWMVDMAKTGIPVDIIPNANHFFSAGNEFELYEKLLDALKK
ncbi:MAG: alpha/beta fold hydrolase [Gammaproteobacteria bacterium]|nr:MAG: alpha/beta fold hydrolase [Gammaproteobacteria bacterium]